jgi:flagellar biosynthesis GTPase FlhF
MEKVVNQLGEDCVILSTKKEDGQIIITASNSSKVKSSVKKRYDKKKFANIYKLNSGKMNLENKEINTPIKDKKTPDINLTVDYKKFIQSEMLSLLEKIDKKLENIYITDESNINNKNFSASLKLKQIGFSNNIINKLLIDNNNDEFEEKG